MQNQDNDRSIDDQLEKLEKRVKKLRAAKKKSARKERLRRKALIAEVYFRRMSKESGALEEIKQVMDRYLKRDADRRLFDLPPING